MVSVRLLVGGEDCRRRPRAKLMAGRTYISIITLQTGWMITLRMHAVMLGCSEGHHHPQYRAVVRRAGRKGTESMPCCDQLAVRLYTSLYSNTVKESAGTDTQQPNKLVNEGS